MPATCVVGLQWGDEAKGKIVDYLTDEFDIVVRFQGGANAGHTVVCDGNTYKLHLIPSGIVRQQVQCVIANGVVLDPEVLLGEMDGITARGIALDGRLLISDRAHVVFPYHKLHDKLLDDRPGSIGTTLRGIGPCYQDKVGRRHGIRVGDMLTPDSFRKRLDGIVEEKNQLLGALYGADPLSADEIYEQYTAYADRLRPFVTDTSLYLRRAFADGKRLMFEGAQGCLLDVDHGTYPFVTSSNSSGCGLSAGAGVPAKMVDRTIGIIKSYCTRVGNGPFPTEQDNDIGIRIRERGKEYGTTTGRPRRCGWFDVVTARNSAELSGVDVLAMMMLDVLSGFDEIKVCVAYEHQGQRLESLPGDAAVCEVLEPIYETFEGWEAETDGIRRREDLPAAAQQYVEGVSELMGVPVGLVSVGPDREQTILWNRF